LGVNNALAWTLLSHKTHRITVLYMLEPNLIGTERMPMTPPMSQYSFSWPLTIVRPVFWEALRALYSFAVHKLLLKLPVEHSRKGVQQFAQLLCPWAPRAGLMSSRSRHERGAGDRSCLSLRFIFVLLFNIDGRGLHFCAVLPCLDVGGPPIQPLTTAYS